MTIQQAIQVQWYWELLHSLVIEYPLALCALALPWTGSLSLLVTMVLVQYATVTLKQSIYQLRGSQGPDSFADVLGWAEHLYEALALDTKLYTGKVKYPISSSKPEGMKLSFRNVSFRHGEGGPLAVSRVSFDIQPGSLALIVGVNGSGKSSLISLIPRLRELSGGEIRIDDKPMTDYDVASLRQAMAGISQDEDMYPLTLRENMLQCEKCGPELTEEPALIDQAAEMGGTYQFIHKHVETKRNERVEMLDAVLDPAPVAGQSMEGCGNAHITRAAIRELEANTPIRLILCDEATGALDPLAEDNILKNLTDMKGTPGTKQPGKTIVLVTHRFAHLAQKADVILVMKEGKLIQQGKHEDLIREQGEYAAMYNAQVDGFSERDV
ncbi:P-loop containing nucleoside triphosphate hydrolase protein [Mycena sp. CBHHK59/15]|nr:P-loop containing nucleoside triphosphate hydrolase protein [Mycena sp. CBHHK59/15]